MPRLSRVGGMGECDQRRHSIKCFCVLKIVFNNLVGWSKTKPRHIGVVGMGAHNQLRLRVNKIISDLKQLSVAEVKEIIMALRSEIDVRGSLSHLPDFQCR
jgi:hypothetical protein